MDYGHDDVIVIDHDDERIIIIDKDGGCIKHARCKIFSLINQCFLVCCTVCLHSKSVEADDDNVIMDQLEHFIPTYQINISSLQSEPLKLFKGVYRKIFLFFNSL